jgi:hypothetical protein
LVTEMDTGFQHFTHGNGHNFSRVGSGTRPATRYSGTLFDRIRDLKKFRL